MKKIYQARKKHNHEENLTGTRNSKGEPKVGISFEKKNRNILPCRREKVMPRVPVPESTIQEQPHTHQRKL